MSDVVLECRQLSKHYVQGKQRLTVLQSVDMTVYRGESLAIVGASGAGKSTLLNLLGGLDSYDEGYVALKGQRYDQMNHRQMAWLRNHELGFVYQFHHLLSEFSAVENTAMPLMIRGIKARQAKARAAEMLDRVGLSGRLHHRPSELSGGERQRVAIARAVVAEPSCVLMDEPTGNLDEKTAENMQQLLAELNQQLGICFIVVTHDRQMAQAQQRRLLLSEGCLTETAVDELV